MHIMFLSMSMFEENYNEAAGIMLFPEHASQSFCAIYVNFNRKFCINRTINVQKTSFSFIKQLKHQLIFKLLL